MAGRFARRRDGTFTVRLVSEEREVLRDLPAQLIAVVEGNDTSDPGVRRLFPSAFLDDAEASAAFDSMTRDDLASQRLAAARTMVSTIDADRLTEEELIDWLAVINDLRLVLGSRLAVTEATRERDFEGDALQAFLLYRFLSGLAGQAVKALSGISEAGLARDVFKRAWKEQGWGEGGSAASEPD